MKLTRIEKFFIRSALRVYLQSRLEAPRVLSNLNIGDGAVCLEIGCGHGAEKGMRKAAYKTPGYLLRFNKESQMEGEK